MLIQLNEAHLQQIKLKRKFCFRCLEKLLRQMNKEVNLVVVPKILEHNGVSCGGENANLTEDVADVGAQTRCRNTSHYTSAESRGVLLLLHGFFWEVKGADFEGRRSPEEPRKWEVCGSYC